MIIYGMLVSGYPGAHIYGDLEIRRLESDGYYYTRLVAARYVGPLAGITPQLPESARAVFHS